MNVILYFFSITLFPNKKDFVTNNSKKIQGESVVKYAKKIVTYAITITFMA